MVDLPVLDMITGKLPDRNRLRKTPDGLMNRKAGRVVVEMTAFITMCQNDIRPGDPKNIPQPRGGFTHTIADGLVPVTQTNIARDDATRRQRGTQLQAPRLGVGYAVTKPLVPGSPP